MKARGLIWAEFKHPPLREVVCPEEQTGGCARQEGCSRFKVNFCLLASGFWLHIMFNAVSLYPTPIKRVENTLFITSYLLL